MKRFCPICKIEKELSEFYFTKGGIVNGRCKKCKSQYRKDNWVKLYLYHKLRKTIKTNKYNKYKYF